MKVIWFSGRPTVGIVQVQDEWDGIKYYIGSPPFIEYAPHNESADTQWIADWGARFPVEVGNILFGEDPLRNGSAVQIPMNKEHAQTMIRLAYLYLETIDA